MTPSEFYKRFGHETSWYYSGGVFTIDNMYKEWNVDKIELREICKNVTFINDNGGLIELSKQCREMADAELGEFEFDGSPCVMNKSELLNILNTCGDLL